MAEKTTTEMRNEAREAFDGVTQTLREFNDRYESDARKINKLNEDLIEKRLELKKLEEVENEYYKENYIQSIYYYLLPIHAEIGKWIHTNLTC